mgnify:CR=1 FL=1
MSAEHSVIALYGIKPAQALHHAFLAAAFQIVSIPTLVVMQDGKVTQQVVGLRPKEQILAMLDRGN